ncbi:hypothetical protein [Candidatus Poriferisodalis sp.]|uniref:hypothetical protein n=1 Tax=Candidatus Poriferisodalis sp. TaxID=3101277 RepID=UPI003B51CA4C
MTFDPDLLTAIRDRFHPADECPIQGPRAFLENAGGSLTLTLDYYSAGVLEPLGLDNCVWVSARHYNTRAEIEQMLATVNRLAGS